MDLLLWMRAHHLYSAESAMTMREIAAARGMSDFSSIHKRLPDLLEDGYVTKCGIRTCRVTGNDALTWAIGDIVPVISIFKGQYSFLSNFFIEPDGTHVEGEYQARKVLPIEHGVENLNPSRAKAWGKKMRGKERPDWHEVNLKIMEDLVMAKFVDHENLRELLLATGDAEIVESNTWHDIFWGRCVCPQHHGEGRNELGIILMKVRAWL